MSSTPLPGVTSVAFPKALVNAFLVEADVLTLIDTGTPGGAGKLLDELGGRELGRILLTHRHADHAGNAAELARRTGAEVHCPPGDAAYITEAREQPRPRAATPLGHPLVAYVKAMLDWTLDPVPGAQASLADGASVGPFRAIATPGHTEGHVSLLWEERGVLFTGDAAANITGVGPHPAADDPDTARRSFEALAGREFDAALFGHGSPIAEGAAAKFRDSA